MTRARILIFASRDTPTLWKEAQLFAKQAKAQLINKRSADLDDLALIARYGVVEPVVVVSSDGRFRFTRIPRLDSLP